MFIGRLKISWYVDDPNSWSGWCAFVSPGVALLPFVDERRLRAALEEVYPDLTPEESKNCSATWSTVCVI